MNQNTEKMRILAVAPTNRGFGYLILEGEKEILAFGSKKARGDNKNEQILSQVEKLTDKWNPNILALQNVQAEDSRRAPRIKELHKALAGFAELRKIRIAQFSRTQLRKMFANDRKGTKHQIAAEIAKQFPDELATKLPAKRRAWDDEDERMSIFDAAALALAFWIKGK